MTMWIGNLLNFGTQFYFNGNDLMMSLTLGFYAICSISLVKLYTNSLNKYELPYSLFNKVLLGSLLLSTALHFLNAGFELTSLPVAIGSTFPLFYLSFCKIFPNWKKSDGFEKVFAIIITFNSMHFLDFPFLRKSITFAPIGFAIAFIFMFIFTVFLPMLTSKYLERKNVEELEDEVRRRTLQLRKVKEDKAQLLNILCHDMSTPLMTIDLHLRKIRRHSNSDINLEKSLDRASFSVKRISDMLLQVKNMSAVEEGKRSIEMQYFNPANLSKVCNQIFADQLEMKNINFSCLNTTENNALLYGNENLITNDIVSNFIANSIKFTKENGTINLNISGNEQYIQIQIIDNGSGMTQESINAIYNNSKQSDLGTNGETGTGLGLSIALFYLERLGATIDIKSRPEKDYPENSGTKISLIFKNKKYEKEILVTT